jgi:hypothetical protein
MNGYYTIMIRLCYKQRQGNTTLSIETYVLLCCICWWGETMSLNCGHQRACCSSSRWHQHGQPQLNDIDTRKQKNSEKTDPLLPCSPQIPHAMTRARTRASATNDRWLSAWHMTGTIRYFTSVLLWTKKQCGQQCSLCTLPYDTKQHYCLYHGTAYNNNNNNNSLL